jgi:hypothetical protein
MLINLPNLLGYSGTSIISNIDDLPHDVLIGLINKKRGRVDSSSNLKANGYYLGFINYFS